MDEVSLREIDWDLMDESLYDMEDDGDWSEDDDTEDEDSDDYDGDGEEW